MTDTILEAIKAAQAAPADDYMVWAEVKSGDTPHEIISHTVRLPQSMPVGNIIDHQRFLASKTLARERGACPDAADFGIEERFSNKLAIAPTAGGFTLSFGGEL